jgi:hypothetical protein
MGCGKPRRVCSVIRKWVNDKQNASVVRRTNNQTHALRPTHEWKCVCVISKGTSTRRETNSYSCKQSAKETFN